MQISAAYNEYSDYINDLTLAQKERLAFIDFNLEFFGKITRNDLINRFRTGLAASTRDFAAYKEIAEYNLLLNHSTKQYLRTDKFEPIFQFSADSILQSVSKGFSDGITASVQPSSTCFEAVQLIHPNVHIIAALMRAIHNQKTCKVKYVSVSSGENTREIVPHTLINNGHRWHVRAFDIKSQTFRDFVCTRFTKVLLTEEPTLPNMLSCADNQFNRLVTLVLMVHPDIKHSLAIEMDYAMQSGEKVMQVRAALAAYVLRYWQVDCSFEHRILNQGCQLALKNHEILANIDNPQLAPGFVKKK